MNSKYEHLEGIPLISFSAKMTQLIINHNQQGSVFLLQVDLSP